MLLKMFITSAPFTCGKERKPGMTISELPLDLEMQDMNSIASYKMNIYKIWTDNVAAYILLMKCLQLHCQITWKYEYNVMQKYKEELRSIVLLISEEWWWPACNCLKYMRKGQLLWFDV